jgi:hypothetical protein
MSDDKSSVFGGNYASAGDSFQITSEFFLSLFELFAEAINFLTEEGGHRKFQQFAGHYRRTRHFGQ